jgi:hypothetical protein
MTTDERLHSLKRFRSELDRATIRPIDMDEQELGRRNDGLLAVAPHLVEDVHFPGRYAKKARSNPNPVACTHFPCVRQMRFRNHEPPRACVPVVAPESDAVPKRIARMVEEQQEVRHAQVTGNGPLRTDGLGELGGTVQGRRHASSRSSTARSSSKASAASNPRSVAKRKARLVARTLGA